MLQNYLVSEKDILAVEEALNLLLKNIKIKKSVFKLNQLDVIDIILFDSEYIYLFSTQKQEFEIWKKSIGNYNIFKIKHKTKIKNKRFGYCGGETGIDPKNLGIITKHCFFSAPLTTFLKFQEKKKNFVWSDKEGYVFTLLHEFAHEYYSLHSNLKNKTNQFLREINKKNIIQLPPYPLLLHELFAALCEFTFSKLLKSSYYNKLKKHIQDEMRKNFNNEEYLFDVHNFAYVLALRLEKDFDCWHDRLLTVQLL